MGKYDRLPQIILGLEQEKAVKEQELKEINDSIKLLSSKLPKKAVVKPSKVEKDVKG